MALNRERVRTYLQKFDFKRLFIEEMGWANPANSRPALMQIEGVDYMRQQITQLSGIGVFEVYPAGATERKIPDAKTRQAIHREIEKIANENLIIFLDDDKNRTESLWYWVKREKNKKYPREHFYLKGQPGDLFLSKLDSLVVEMDELRPDGTIPITDAARKLTSALDIERVTKRFYTEFSDLRDKFVLLILGIDKEADRNWYASVLLNRLMFIYFLQKKGFVQNNTHYLEEKLEASRRRGTDRFYSEFLTALFFEGFAKPEDQRAKEANTLLGPIKYLNGGLFIRHPLEEKYPTIRVPDAAFGNVLKLFGAYSWHLDDTPGASDNEINPDVLGYIFEKYINQKAFGAYYTRTEITQYLCERTIHAAILDRLNEVSQHPFNHLGDALLSKDPETVRLLLNEVLPKLSVLDPACGSGAFLVAAMKTLLDIYGALIGKIEVLNDHSLTRQLQAIRREHPSINYYVRKRIITDNLHGVDIMQEATEIARLRLFLALVASVSKVDDLEPLPNIDFNIMAGNSLIGLLTVDDKRFDRAKGKGQAVQHGLFGSAGVQQYRDLLAEKNRLIALYRGSSSLTEDLRSLRDRIDSIRCDHYAALNGLLLEDFQALGIKYEHAQADGKTKKRPLTAADIGALEPFHWGYEFDEIVGTRGGFDVIITNPPWEIFKPQGKEFFADYNDLVTKNKMDIKEFEKEQERLLQDPETRDAWLEYQSRFPHVNLFYRAASQYKNQNTLINGKKTGTDINLYKLFTEQCFNLLRNGGLCGVVIPSGIYTDLGSKQLREMLFERTQITGLFGFENRKTIFEGVDSRFKFVVLTFRRGGRTGDFPAAFMRHDVRELETFPADDSLCIGIELIRRLSPDSLSIMEFNTELDLQVAIKILNFPALGEHVASKWQLEFHREFHMTDDSYLFHQEPEPGMLPLYEGKMIHQFDHNLTVPRYWIREVEGRKAILGRIKDTGQSLGYQTYRLAYRAVARNTDMRTLICTIIPSCFTGNSLNVSEGLDNQIYLIAASLLNSFVVDWVLRQKVSANINMFYLYQLPVPRLFPGDPYFNELISRSARLICTTPEFNDLANEVGLGDHKAGVTEEVARNKLRAEIDGIVAHLYGLTEVEFAHILGTFLLVPEPVKVAAQNAYRDVERGLIK